MLTAPLGEVTFDINESVVVKEDNLFLVCGNDGVLPLDGPHPLGLYYNDCRFLSGHELTVLGHAPRLLVCSATGGRGAVHEMTNAELSVEHGRVVPPQSLQIRLERELRANGLDERITLVSFDPEPVAGDVVLRLNAGFEPMMWLRGAAPEFWPKRARTVAAANGIAIEVKGRDRLLRRTQVAARPRPLVNGRELRWPVRLRRGRPETIAIRFEVQEGEDRRAVSPPRRRHRRARSDGLPAGHTRVTTDDQLFDRILGRSLADLAVLRSRLGRQTYYAAGIPWYATLFGRDSLITAMEMLAYAQGVAEQTVRVLGERLGRELNDERDEEPGKVLHEMRVGELANLGAMPFAQYYGSADSTPLFLCLLAEHADWSGSLKLFRSLRPQVDAALEWIDRWGDLDGDGLVEYARRSPDGLRNQGWKDSEDGVVDGRGRPLEPPIALVEVQGYVVRAKRRIARLFELDGDPERGRRLREEATVLRERIDASFWLGDRGWYSMGLDGRNRASAALASNQGHLLWSLAVSQERARAVRDALMSDALHSGWGIRTLADDEPGYNPVGYHTGSVWPHDTALIAFGLRKYGFDEDFLVLFEGLLDAASHFADYRLPELFAGFSRRQYDIPVPYPVACHPQAWAAGSIPYLLRAGLGIIPDALGGRLRIVRPSLPRWLNHVEVEGLRLGGARIDLRFERAAGQVTIADVRIDGDADVVLEISPTRDPEIGT